MKHTSSIVSIALVATCASLASAAVYQVDVQGISTPSGQGVSVTGHSGYAGQIGLALSNTVNGPNLDGNWIAYCTEVDQNISIGGGAQTYNVLPLSDLPIPGAGMGTQRADAIARMWYSAGGAQYGANSEYSAAFQVAIWEIYHDYTGTLASLDLGAGSFMASGGITGTMAGYLTSLFAAADGNGPMATLLGLGSEGYQDQIIENGGDAPAPGAIALLGAAGLFGSRRRRA